MPRSVINGLQHFYTVEGDGQPVLFIHGGYGGPAAALAPPHPAEIADALPLDTFQIICYDRRNCGQSEVTLSRFSLKDLAVDARSLLDHLGVGPTIVIGSSAGGPIALQFALDYPDRTLALCLANTGPFLMNPERPRARAMLDLVAAAREHGDRTVFESRVAALREPPPLLGISATSNTAIARDKALRQTLSAVPDEDLFRPSTGALRNIEAYEGHDFSDRLHELRMPVCIIHGTADQLVPFAWGETLHAGIRGSEFHAIPEAEHGVLLYPEAQQRLREWARRVLSPR